MKQERRRANSRRLYSLAAAVVVFAMLSIGALFAGGRWFAPDDQGARHQRPRSATASQLDPLPHSQGGTGIGGPDLPGKRYSATDPRSGVALDVGLEKKDWGTQISFAISNITGPLDLPAVRGAHRRQRRSRWPPGSWERRAGAPPPSRGR